MKILSVVHDVWPRVRGSEGAHTPRGRHEAERRCPSCGLLVQRGHGRRPLTHGMHEKPVSITSAFKEDGLREVREAGRFQEAVDYSKV